MTSLAGMTDRVIGLLQGSSRDQEEQTWILSAIGPADLSVRVQDPKTISRGLVEIGDELLWVARVDPSTSDVQIAPYGRGYQSTTAAAHAELSRMTNAPKWPRASVQAMINDTIVGVYPDLYVIGTTEFAAVAARTTYDLPADVDLIHSVSTQTIGPTRRWANLSRWRFNSQSDTSAFLTGKSIDLYQEPIPGQTVRITYARPPARFVDTSTEFASATGLNATAEECIIFGACMRLVGLTESPRLQIASIESTVRATAVPSGSSQAAFRHFLQLYQLALQSERERLQRSNPTSTHFRYV